MSFYNSKGKELIGDDDLNIVDDFDNHQYDGISVSQRDIDSLTSEFDAEDTSNVRYRDSPSFGDSLLLPVPEDKALEEPALALEEPSAPEEAPLATEEPPLKRQRTSFPKPDLPMVSQDDDIDSDEETNQLPSQQNLFNNTLDDYAAHLREHA